MLLPSHLREELEARAERYGISEIVLSARTISQQYRDGSVNGAHVVSSERDALAYALSRMPATYGAVRDALFQTAHRMPDGAVRSVLDVGAGTGAGTWAAWAEFAPEKTLCLEREKAMRDIGSSLMETCAQSPREKAEWRAFDLTKDALGEKGDLVLASYVLNELKASDREKALAKLWNAANQALVLVEPGTPAGWNLLMEARTWLLKNGGHVAAPCPHDEPCPLPENDWCHFSCRVARSRMHKALKGADAPYEDEKYSYLSVTRERCVPAENRVLRHPIIEPGRITLHLCGREGITTRVVRKRDGELFRRARKTAWGEEME